MHRSRIGSIMIDCDDLQAGVHFWSNALGASIDEVIGMVGTN